MSVPSNNPTPAASRPATYQRLWISLSLMLVAASCAVEPVTQQCSRYDVPSMGAENGFRITIPPGVVPALADGNDHLDVALSIVPPIAAPLTLVHTVGGEQSRWNLKIVAGPGLSTRCRLAGSKSMSTCGASLGSEPLSAEGDWSLESNGNQLIEGALAFRICR